MKTKTDGNAGEKSETVNQVDTGGKRDVNQLTQAEYARHRGVSRQYVSALGKRGVLVLVDGFIDAAATDERLDQEAGYAAGQCADARGDDTGDADANERASADQNAGDDAETKFEADTRAAIASANLKELDFRERAGQLVERVDVERAWFEVVRRTRDGILAIPDRLPLSKEARLEVRAELTKALESIADEIATIN